MAACVLNENVRGWVVAVVNLVWGVARLVVK